MAKKVFIGVGHGGKDPGAVANGLKEANLNLDVAKACRDTLKNHGVTVQLSRDNDASENLAQRIKECKAFNPDLAVDIHFNAGGGDGAEVYHAKKDKSDDAFAKNVLDELIKIGQNSRGLKTKTTSSGTDYFGFVRQIPCPSVLIECAFIDNKNDIKIADTLAERKTMGVAIAKGILKTLGITYKTESKKPANTTVTFKDGDKVKLSSNAVVYGTTKKFASFVYKSTLYVRGNPNGNRVVISTLKTGAVTGAVDKKYLTKIK